MGNGGRRQRCSCSRRLAYESLSRVQTVTSAAERVSIAPGPLFVAWMSRRDKSCSREPARRGLHGATWLSFPEWRKISGFRRIAGTAQERSCLLRGVDNGGRKEAPPQRQGDRSSPRNRSWSSAGRLLAGYPRLRWNKPAALLPVCRTPKLHLAQNSAQCSFGLRQLNSDRTRCTETTRAIQAKAKQTE